MCGTAKKIGNVFSSKNIVRGLEAGATGGLSEWTHKDPFGGINNPLGLRSIGLFGGESSTPALAAAPGGQSPTELLAQTGGAPVLSQIAMGVDAKTALAGFMGIPKEQFDEYVKGLNPKDAYALKSTQDVLETIQQNTDLRNQAVQKVLADFPHLSINVAKERAAAGAEFDETTKAAVDQALNGTAAKYAAGGNLSSGAANEAFSRVGADHAIDKLNYMGQREGVATENQLNEYQSNLAGYNSRLAEVNALRDFQNTMLGQGASQGFSAAQANLGRVQQAGMANAGYQNQQIMQNQANDNASQNALFGAIGSLGGAFIGGSMLNGAMGAGAGAGASAGGSAVQSGYFNQAAPKFYNTSYGRTLGR
jgi:hypothetical protein